jgi:hypothetical protein
MNEKKRRAAERSRKEIRRQTPKHHALPHSGQAVRDKKLLKGLGLDKKKQRRVKKDIMKAHNLGLFS